MLLLPGLAGERRGMSSPVGRTPPRGPRAARAARGARTNLGLCRGAGIAQCIITCTILCTSSRDMQSSLADNGYEVQLLDNTIHKGIVEIALKLPVVNTHSPCLTCRFAYRDIVQLRTASPPGPEMREDSPRGMIKTPVSKSRCPPACPPEVQNTLPGSSTLCRPRE